MKPGLWAALLDLRWFHSVVSDAVSTRNALDPALGRRMGPKGPFYPSGSHYAIWGKVSNVAFYVNVESETFGYWHDNATSAHERLVSNKAARIDRWCSEVAQWLLLPQHPVTFLTGAQNKQKGKNGAQNKQKGCRSRVLVPTRGGKSAQWHYGQACTCHVQRALRQRLDHA